MMFHSRRILMRFELAYAEGEVSASSFSFFSENPESPQFKSIS